MQCRLRDSLAADETARLDAFLANSPAAAHMQRVIWPEIAQVSRLQQFRYLTCEADGELLLAGIVRFTLLFPGCYLALMPRGPVVWDISSFSRCLPAVKKTLRRAGVVTVLANPMWADDDADALCDVLAANGFEEVPRNNQEMYRLTGCVDLRSPEEEIFGGLKKRCRREIRRAERQGVKVRSVKGEADVLQFRQLFEEFSAGKDYEVSGLPDLIDQWRYVMAEGGVFDLAEIDGRLVGGLVAFGEGKRATLKTLASLPVLPQIPRSYNLVWEAIRELKRQGFEEFDLGGLDESALQGGEAGGRDFFKLAFNPRVLRLVPMHVLALRPVAYALLFRARQAYRRTGLPRLLGPLLKRRDGTRRDTRSGREARP